LWKGAALGFFLQGFRKHKKLPPTSIYCCIKKYTQLYFYSLKWLYESHIIKHKANSTCTFSPLMCATCSNKFISFNLTLLMIFGKYYKLQSSSYTFYSNFLLLFVWDPNIIFRIHFSNNWNILSSVNTKSYAL
jgi:hypothetical protein